MTFEINFNQRIGIKIADIIKKWVLFLFLQKDIETPEKVQKRAAKVVPELSQNIEIKMKRKRDIKKKENKTLIFTKKKMIYFSFISYLMTLLT